MDGCLAMGGQHTVHEHRWLATASVGLIRPGYISCCLTNFQVWISLWFANLKAHFQIDSFKRLVSRCSSVLSQSGVWRWRSDYKISIYVLKTQMIGSSVSRLLPYSMLKFLLPIFNFNAGKIKNTRTLFLLIGHCSIGKDRIGPPQSAIDSLLKALGWYTDISILRCLEDNFLDTKNISSVQVAILWSESFDWML